MKKLVGIIGAALPLLCSALSIFAQTSVALPQNWQHLDLMADGFFGISTNRAYTELLKGKKGKEVLVAVIDNGVDTNHIDLRPQLLSKKKVLGWSFLGSKNGNVYQETLELTRLFREGKQQATAYQAALQKTRQSYQYLNTMKLVLDTIIQAIGPEQVTVETFKRYMPETELQNGVKATVVADLNKNPDFNAMKAEVHAAVIHFREQLDYALNVAFDPRPSLVGDRIMDLAQRDYGTSDVMGPAADHGSHVSGLIGATRNNGIGIDGVADHVKIMNIRAVPNGDERDKDVGNAIRYAVDHGARVINMSFGKAFSPDKKFVDEAVRYAMQKDVLMIHAAGNESTDLDHEGTYYPSKNYADEKGSAGAWIQVGASGSVDDKTLVASFSNYGQACVDVFAPGVDLYSTVPNSAYKLMSGTSMAAPVVAGLAALIRSHYPKLPAGAVKDIIIKTVTKVNHPVEVVRNGKKITIPFSEVCVSGGIVNAYEALKLASSYNKR